MYVRAEVDCQRQFIKIDNIDEVTFHGFVKMVVDKFQIKDAAGKKVHISDQLNTRVNDDALLKYLIEFASENLILKVQFKSKDSSTKDFFTSEDIESYLKANGGKDILKEYDEMDTLTEAKRHKLVNLLVDMLIDRYGLYPKSLEKTMLAKAAIILFPRFKVDGTQHGTEIFFDSPNSSEWFVPVLKVRRKANKRDINENSNDDENQTNVRLEYTEESAKDDVEFMRIAIVSQANMEIIGQKLKATMDYRKKLCNDANIDLLERFPYLFTHPELVLLDFNHRFGSEPRVFPELWENVKAKIQTTYNLHHTTKDFSTDFDEEIENFLMLLNLLRERQKGRKTHPSRLNFDDLIEKLVVSSKVGEPLTNALKKDNKQPYIVVTMHAKKVIRYNIVVDQKVMNVHESFHSLKPLIFSTKRILFFICLSTNI